MKMLIFYSKFASYSLTVLSLCLASLTLGAASTNLPNIIFIMADDLGYGDLGIYGQKFVETPNIDRLAENGIRFTNHYSGHSVCRPSRLSLWTGLHTGHTGLTTNREFALTDSHTTVAQAMQNAGYVTGGVGKWALASGDSGHPNDHGFDYWMGYLDQGNAHNYYPPFLWENKQKIELVGNILDTSEEAFGRVSEVRTTYSHDVMTKAAFDFIRRHSDNPFLLHMHLTIPHANNELGKMGENGMEVPDFGIYEIESWPEAEKGFAAMITLMDRDIGKLIDLLAELNIEKNTLVIFTSDNGPHMSGGHDHTFFNSNGPLRGVKGHLYEGGIRVPFIASWPGKIEANTVSDHTSAFWDYYPTLMEITGVDIPENIDGISYLPTLINEHENQKKHEYLYWAKSNSRTQLAVRYKNWKLVKYRSRGVWGYLRRTEWQLFDLEQDLGEENNVAKLYPDIVKEIVQLLERKELL